MWFESGISHFAVLLNNPQLQFPADIYLEGKDQHRAWFQSALLTAMVLEDQNPMKAILTHGFTVDGDGKKMSKSLGNVISPDQMIKDLGTDGLRLWVSSIDYADDAVVSPVLLGMSKRSCAKFAIPAGFCFQICMILMLPKMHCPGKLVAIDANALQECSMI